MFRLLGHVIVCVYGPLGSSIIKLLSSEPYLLSITTNRSFHLRHQSSKDGSAVCAASEERPTCCRREYQNYLANTPNEKVLNVLILVTQQTSVWVGKASPSPSVSSPTLVVSNQPHEETAFGGSPLFPYSFIRPEANSALEEGIIDELCSISYLWI